MPYYGKVFNLVLNGKLDVFKQVKNGIDSGFRNTCLVEMWRAIAEDRKLERGSPIMRSLQ